MCVRPLGTFCNVILSPNVQSCVREVWRLLYSGQGTYTWCRYSEVNRDVCENKRCVIPTTTRLCLHSVIPGRKYQVEDNISIATTRLEYMLSVKQSYSLKKRAQTASDHSYSGTVIIGTVGPPTTRSVLPQEIKSKATIVSCAFRKWGSITSGDRGHLRDPDPIHGRSRTAEVCQTTTCVDSAGVIPSERLA